VLENFGNLLKGKELKFDSLKFLTLNIGDSKFALEDPS
jgi:hypothetical protein